MIRRDTRGVRSASSRFRSRQGFGLVEVLFAMAVTSIAIISLGGMLRYNSCFVANAAARFGGLVPLRNTSVDNWPVY